MPPPHKALIVDVDGVVSPVHPGNNALWGDEVVAGHLFGPVLVSPTLCERLDLLDRAPDVRCWWLTSWSPEMRARMDPFPGRAWPVIAEQADVQTTERAWWKLTALEAWLDHHPEIRALAWCDDHLRGGRPAAVMRRLTARRVEPLLLAPALEVGLNRQHVARLLAWAELGPTTPRRRPRPRRRRG